MFCKALRLWEILKDAHMEVKPSTLNFRNIQVIMIKDSLSFRVCGENGQICQNTVIKLLFFNMVDQLTVEYLLSLAVGSDPVKQGYKKIFMAKKSCAIQ